MLRPDLYSGIVIFAKFQKRHNDVTAVQEGPKPFLSMDQIAKESIPESSPIWVLDRWWMEKLGPDGRLPPRSAVDPTELGAAVIPWVFLARVLRDASNLDYCFRLVGTANTQLVGYDATGMSASDLFRGDDRAQIKLSFDETVLSGEPTFWSATIPHKQNFPVPVYRALYPLAADGKTADHLIGVAIPDGGQVPK